MSRFQQANVFPGIGGCSRGQKDEVLEKDKVGPYKESLLQVTRRDFTIEAKQEGQPKSNGKHRKINDSRGRTRR